MTTDERKNIKNLENKYTRVLETPPEQSNNRTIEIALKTIEIF